MTILYKFVIIIYKVLCSSAILLHISADLGRSAIHTTETASLRPLRRYADLLTLTKGG